MKQSGLYKTLLGALVATCAVPNLFSQDVPAEKAPVKEPAPKEAAVAVEEVVPAAEVVKPPRLTPAELAASQKQRREAMAERRRVRDAAMRARSEVAEKIEVRRKALLAENEEAAKLNAEIEELRTALKEKTAALDQIYAADAALMNLKKELQQAHSRVDGRNREMRREVREAMIERMENAPKRSRRLAAPAPVPAAKDPVPAPAAEKPEAAQ